MPILLLAASLAALLVGPVLSGLTARTRAPHDFVEGLGLVLVVGLGVLFLLPHALEHGGVWALSGLLVGLAAPLLWHRVQAHPKGELALGLGLLAVHAALDGSALGVFHDDHADALAMAVVAHRLPVGFLVFSWVGARASGWSAWGAIGLLLLATVGGYAVGAPIELPHAVEGVLEGLVVGALLHVVAHPHSHDHESELAHDHSHSHHHDPPAGVPRAEVAGALTAVALLGGFTAWSLSGAHVHHVGDTGHALLELLLVLSPVALGLLALETGWILRGLDPAPLLHRLRFASGQAVDRSVPWIGAVILAALLVPRMHERLHEWVGGPLQWVCLVAFAGLAVSSLIRQGPRGLLRRLTHRT